MWMTWRRENGGRWDSRVDSGGEGGPGWGRVENDSQITGKEVNDLCLTRGEDGGRQGLWMAPRLVRGTSVYLDSSVIAREKG